MCARYLLFALDSPFSRPVLQSLLTHGCPPAALILPNPDRTAPPHPYSPTPQQSDELDSLPLISPSPPSGETLTQTAARHGIPIIVLGDLCHPDALDALCSHKPDLLLTACFPRLLPPEILAIPRLGSLNLHPSLLPTYRGPEPLFWQFYFGETRTGVTLHFMDENADTGGIVYQAKIRFTDGITLTKAESIAAQAGGELLVRALSDPNHLPHTPQPEQGASYHPRPVPDDLTVPTTWAARRAFNFIRAAHEWGPLEIIDQAGQRFRVRDAMEYITGFVLAPPALHDRSTPWIRFSDGLVRVVLSG